MKRTNIAILGAGAIAATMAKTLKQMKGVCCYAVAAREPERAQAFAKKYGFQKAYGSYEEMVADDKVELVYVATPHSHHYEHAKLCIEHGRAVLCEKAFTANAAQAEELFRLAQEKNVFITEAIWTRYMPFLRTIREVLASGVIGDLKFLEANLSYPIDNSPRMLDKELAGGSLLDLGVYTLHFAAMIFGAEVEKIFGVCTYTESGVDEQENITLVFRDHKMASLTCSMLCRGDRRGVVHGTKGFAVIENINNFESMTVYDENGRKTAFYKRPKQISGYEYEVLASIQALQKGWLEYPDILHAETVRIMKQMDELRARYGVVYPFEK